jgi:hypothetical protein
MNQVLSEVSSQFQQDNQSRKSSAKGTAEAHQIFRYQSP